MKSSNYTFCTNKKNTQLQTRNFKFSFLFCSQYLDESWFVDSSWLKKWRNQKNWYRRRFDKVNDYEKSTIIWYWNVFVNRANIERLEFFDNY